MHNIEREVKPYKSIPYEACRCSLKLQLKRSAVALLLGSTVLAAVACCLYHLAFSLENYLF